MDFECTLAVDIDNDEYHERWEQLRGEELSYSSDEKLLLHKMFSYLPKIDRDYALLRYISGCSINAIACKTQRTEMQIGRRLKSIEKKLQLLFTLPVDRLDQMVKFRSMLPRTGRLVFDVYPETYSICECARSLNVTEYAVSIELKRICSTNHTNAKLNKIARFLFNPKLNSQLTVRTKQQEEDDATTDNRKDQTEKKTQQKRNTSKKN